MIYQPHLKSSEVYGICDIHSGKKEGNNKKTRIFKYASNDGVKAVDEMEICSKHSDIKKGMEISFHPFALITPKANSRVLKPILMNL
jgi:hypothetical protein